MDGAHPAANEDAFRLANARLVVLGTFFKATLELEARRDEAAALSADMMVGKQEVKVMNSSQQPLQEFRS